MAASMKLFEVDIERTAVISPCGLYRYRLGRRWDDGPYLNAVMLNPSVADAERDDATITRLQVRASKLKFGGLVVTNLFAFRATYPVEMLNAADPIGQENDAAILEAARGAGLVLAGWGNLGRHLDRAAAVRKMLADAGIHLHCLRKTGEGEPGHPLYCGYSLKPVRME